MITAIHPDGTRNEWLEIRIAPLLHPQSRYVLGRTVWVGAGLWADMLAVRHSDWMSRVFWSVT